MYTVLVEVIHLLLPHSLINWGKEDIHFEAKRGRYSIKIMGWGIFNGIEKYTSWLLLIFVNVNTNKNYTLASEVNLQIILSSAVLHILNWVFHCSTLTAELHKQIAFFLTVQQAVTPTKDFPAPQGSTITPDLNKVCSQRSLKVT